MEHNAILDSRLSLSSNIPLYAQLVGIIKREISSGALKIGDLLPSEAELLSDAAGVLLLPQAASANSIASARNIHTNLFFILHSP